MALRMAGRIPIEAASGLGNLNDLPTKNMKLGHRLGTV